LLRLLLLLGGEDWFAVGIVVHFIRYRRPLPAATGCCCIYLVAQGRRLPRGDLREPPSSRTTSKSLSTRASSKSCYQGGFLHTHSTPGRERAGGRAPAARRSTRAPTRRASAPRSTRGAAPAPCSSWRCRSREVHRGPSSSAASPATTNNSRGRDGARGRIEPGREGSYAHAREVIVLRRLTSRVARQRRCQEVRRAAGTARKRSTGWAGRGGAPATRSRRRTRRQDREERGSSRGRKSESRKRRSIASDACVDGSDERVVPISLVK
jgi:hypothetical protein